MVERVAQIIVERLAQIIERLAQIIERLAQIVECLAQILERLTQIIFPSFLKFLKSSTNAKHI